MSVMPLLPLNPHWLSQEFSSAMDSTSLLSSIQASTSLTVNLSTIYARYSIQRESFFKIKENSSIHMIDFLFQQQIQLISAQILLPAHRVHKGKKMLILTIAIFVIRNNILVMY